MKGESIMGDFFDDLGKRINDTVDDISKLAEDTMEIQKYKSQIKSLKRENTRDYVDMGKVIYQRYLDGKEVDEELVKFCEEIQERIEDMKDYAQKIDRVKGL